VAVGVPPELKATAWMEVRMSPRFMHPEFVPEISKSV
jgi:hypothetical protein